MRNLVKRPASVADEPGQLNVVCVAAPRLWSETSGRNDNAPLWCRGEIKKKSFIGALAVSTMLSPIAAMAQTEVHI
ncbi:Glycerol-3-phosphate ABC transporter, periplasmic glycerol-3-phosphate-binding protein [Sulfitobacter geojensis]|nr:Glycerol-3-phosphate ABC transporter, periplasmic glycerol-3-phosphate-binding protein [Sulfitobacter geojensis]